MHYEWMPTMTDAPEGDAAERTDLEVLVSGRQPKEKRVLLLATQPWTTACRVAGRFAKHGIRVFAVCPPCHPLRHTKSVSKRFHYGWLFPEAALQRAIDKIGPDLLIPFDDGTVMHLHALHRTTTSSATRDLIERSLGRSIEFPLIDSRFEFLELAAKLGLHVPPSMRLRSETDLNDWDQPFPWLLKSTMSWGGTGVRVVNSKHEAREAFRLMSRPMGRVKAVWRWLNGNGFYLRPAWARVVPEIIVQGFVPGTPANAAFACWNGKVLGNLSVRALKTDGPTGQALSVQVVESADMETAVKTMAHELSLSGLNGLDFMIDANGVAWLIECNPRVTQVCHVLTVGHSSLADRLADALCGRPVSTECPVEAGTVITMFPRAWQTDPSDTLLRSCLHDVPWEDPDLLRALLAPPKVGENALVRMARKIASSQAKSA